MGSSVHLYTRIADYYYNNDNHGKISPIISRALTKYNHSNFKLSVFLVSSADSKFMEQLVIDILQPEYNILRVAGSPFGFKLVATFPNIARCSTTLAINRNTISRRIEAKKVFIYNGSSYNLIFLE